MRKTALVVCLVVAAGVALLSGAERDVPSLPAPLPVADAPYSGNTHTYKFHRKGCRYFACPNCTAKFRTRKEAVEAGYRPCGVCDP